MKNKYQITYFYLATGMEGIPDVEDMGIIEASTEKEAINIACFNKYPEGKDVMYGPDNKWSSRDFLRTCLSAKKIN